MYYVIYVYILCYILFIESSCIRGSIKMVDSPGELLNNLVILWSSTDSKCSWRRVEFVSGASLFPLKPFMICLYLWLSHYRSCSFTILIFASDLHCWIQEEQWRDFSLFVQDSSIFCTKEILCSCNNHPVITPPTHIIWGASNGCSRVM